MYYFTYVYVLAGGPISVLSIHPTQLEAQQTKDLICSGAQVSDLLHVSEIHPLDETHHARSRANR